MQIRKSHRKRASFNLLGKYLEWLYGELGILSDKELAEKSGVHQTTISTIKRTHRCTLETLLRLLEALQSYPSWDEGRHRHDLFVAADHADPEDQQELQRRMRKSGRSS